MTTWLTDSGYATDNSNITFTLTIYFCVDASQMTLYTSSNEVAVFSLYLLMEKLDVLLLER